MGNVLEYLSDPQVERLMRAGFKAFRAGATYNSPYEPSFENMWWLKGWECAALAKHLAE